MSGLQPNCLSFDVTVTAVAAALSSNTTFRDEVTVLADESNDQTVYVGGDDDQTFPLDASDWVSIKKTSFASIYVKSASGSQTLHVICGGN